MISENFINLTILMAIANTIILLTSAIIAKIEKWN